MTLPFASGDFPERYEGMLVRMPQTLYVTEHFQLGRFGQVLMSSGGVLKQPTNVVAPGAPAAALQAQNDLNKIIVDDALQNQNPDPILFGRGGKPLSASNTLRGGDTATGDRRRDDVHVGRQRRERQRLPRSARSARSAAACRTSSRRTRGRRRAPRVGGNVRVVAMNLLNFFNTFGTTAAADGVGGAATDCRGADTPGRVRPAVAEDGRGDPRR